MSVIEVLTIPVPSTSISILSNSHYSTYTVCMYMYILELNYMTCACSSVHLLFSTSVCYALVQQHLLTDAHHRKKTYLSSILSYMYNIWICIYMCACHMHMYNIYVHVYKYVAENVVGRRN